MITHLLMKHPCQIQNQRQMDNSETVYAQKRQNILQPGSLHWNRNSAPNISIPHGSQSRNQLHWRQTIATRPKKDQKNTLQGNRRQHPKAETTPDWFISCCVPEGYPIQRTTSTYSLQRRCHASLSPHPNQHTTILVRWNSSQAWTRTFKGASSYLFLSVSWPIGRAAW